VRRVRKLSGLILSAALLAPSGVVLAQQPQPQEQQQPQQSDKDAVYEQLNLFDEAFERIRQDAVDPVADKKLVDAAIGGMLSGLDPHAAYIDPAEYQALNAPTGSDEVGIGVALALDKGQLKVISPRDGSPAATAGIEPGDLIFSIGKQPTYEMTLADAQHTLRGPPGSTVALVLQRGSGGPIKIKVKRAGDQLQTVTDRVEDGDLGYLRLAGFDDGTPAALAAAVQDLRRQTGGKLAGLVLDLRNNPGGNFQDAVAAAAAFLDKGDIALLKGRNPDSLKHVTATPDDLVKGLPIVALVNGGTAAESELVAGALQDNHRAILLGTKTYGESNVETVIPLASGGAIRLTTARFTTPDGREIDGKGLKPDLTVTPVKLEKLAQGEEIHEVDLPGALKNPNQPLPTASPATATTGGKASPTAKPVKPALPPGATPTPHKSTPSVSTGEIGGANDLQLTQALDILRGLAVFNRGVSG
jgi:carboxyl-terminal processing protease